MYSERIKELREDNDLLQKEVAAKIGCATYSYQRYEYGEKMIPIDKLITLANLYNVSTDYILGQTNDPTPPKRKGNSKRAEINLNNLAKE